MKKYIKYPLFRKGPNDFEAECITYGCICTIRKNEWKDYCRFFLKVFQEPDSGP